MSNWSSLPLQKTWQSNAGPSSQKSSYTHELYIGLWLARDVRESSSVASSRHREHTQGIKGLRVPPDVLTFSLLFFCFFSFQWPVGGGGVGAKWWRERRRRAAGRKWSWKSVVESPPLPRGFGGAAAAGGRRLEAAMFMRWRPIDEAHKEGITIWSDVSISNTFSLGCSKPVDSSTAKKSATEI